MKVDDTAPLIIDAINILITDHCDVEECFRVFAGTAPEMTDLKKTLGNQICRSLRIHMAIEEEIFYPAVRATVVGAKDNIWDGVIEHDKARVLLDQLEAMHGDERMFELKIEELAAIVAHHVKEEENEVFPKVINSALDNEELGRKMLKRKAELCHAIEAEEPADAGAVSS
jgi:iron-sulfur cluster repair protein YtfE (RIC family)